MTNTNERENRMVINGIKFYYDDDFELTDEVMNHLEKFSLSVDPDDGYSVYLDNGRVVIY